MDLHQLKVFVEVVRQNGFSAAASLLHSTQPTVSRIVSHLEDELGHRLLVRRSRALDLTPVGKLVHRRALALLTEASMLQSDLEDMKHIRKGELTLGVPPLGNVLLLPLVKAFKQRYPGIDLHLLDGGTLTLEEALNIGRAEIGTLLGPIKTDQYDSISVIHDRLVVVVPKNSPLAKRRRLRLWDLKSESLILFPAGFLISTRIIVACQNAGFQPRITSYNGQWQFILAMVESGLGLTLLPESAVVGTPSLTKITLYDPVIPWEIQLAWLRGTPLSYPAQALLNLARTMLPFSPPSRHPNAFRDGGGSHAARSGRAKAP